METGRFFSITVLVTGMAGCAHDTVQVCDEVAMCGVAPQQAEAVPQPDAAPVEQAATPPETAPAPRKAPVRYADANNDGKVTKDEAQADRWLRAAFDDYDANGDGILDRAEFAELVADSNKRHPQPKAEIAKLETPPPAVARNEPAPLQSPAPEKAQEPATQWRCRQVDQERHCPGMAPRER